jgi:hypothetical protein
VFLQGRPTQNGSAHAVPDLLVTDFVASPPGSRVRHRFLWFEECVGVCGRGRKRKVTQHDSGCQGSRAEMRCNRRSGCRAGWWWRFVVVVVGRDTGFREKGTLAEVRAATAGAVASELREWVDDVIGGAPVSG